MIEITFPLYPFKIREEKGREMIFDEIRKQWLVLTPEEWVRQNFIQYLIGDKAYPPSLLAVEKEIRLGDLRRRCDIVVYKNSLPWMVVECKEMNVPLTQSTIRQVLNYNVKLQVVFLVITNGRSTYAVHITNGRADWINEIPRYD